MRKSSDCPSWRPSAPYRIADPLVAPQRGARRQRRSLPPLGSNPIKHNTCHARCGSHLQRLGQCGGGQSAVVSFRHMSRSCKSGFATCPRANGLCRCKIRTQSDLCALFTVRAVSLICARRRIASCCTGGAHAWQLKSCGPVRSPVRVLLGRSVDDGRQRATAVSVRPAWCSGAGHREATSECCASVLWILLFGTHMKKSRQTAEGDRKPKPGDSGGSVRSAFGRARRLFSYALFVERKAWKARWQSRSIRCSRVVVRRTAWKICWS